MEIDFLPSVQEDKSLIASDKNVGDSTDELHVGEEAVNSPRTRNEAKGVGIHVGENFSRSGEGLDEDAFVLGTFSKGIKSYVPQKGLEFESKEEAYSFYREYARSVGFGITIKASRRSKKSGKFIDVKIACSRFGSKPDSSTAVNSRSCPKTDCKASMHMKRRKDGKWFIFSFVEEHNHEICPDFYYALSGRGKQSGSVACQKKGLQLAFDEVDVQVVFEFFMLMQDENPNFFYAIDLDHEKRMRTVFWVDAKSRHDYSKFCDVVFFDSYYVRNKYRVPFAPIVGVNHHFQLMLLGCALIGEETTSTFVWLMRTWLRAVGGQTPKVIITDEDKSLEEAIAEVFPDTGHCFCLWNVLRKIPESLCHIANRPEKFMRKLKKCIYRSWTQEEFEKRWWKMMDKFELREDERLQSLYGNCKKWVPAYMSGGVFLAGLCTGERSECISSLFDKYLHRETSCKEFMDQYKVFLHERSEEEAKADFKTRHNFPLLRSLSSFEKQMSTVYTHSIFKKCQVEVLGANACRVQKTFEDKAVVTYLVDDFEERQSFIVAWNEADLLVSCLCRSFEYKGFLCRHALIVLQMSGVSNIPSHYILQRWKNDANIRLLGSEMSSNFHFRVQRFNDLCKRAIKLGEKGSLSQDTYNIVVDVLQEAMEHCVGVNTSVRCVSEPNMLTTQGFLSTEEENQCNSLAKASKKKKIHRKRKVQCETEVITSRVQDYNLQMGHLDSGAHNVDNTCVPQQDMPGML